MGDNDLLTASLYQSRVERSGGAPLTACLAGAGGGAAPSLRSMVISPHHEWQQIGRIEEIPQR